MDIDEKKKNIIIISVIVSLVIGLGLFGYYLYQKKKKREIVPKLKSANIVDEIITDLEKEDDLKFPTISESDLIIDENGYVLFNQEKLSTSRGYTVNEAGNIQNQVNINVTTTGKYKLDELGYIMIKETEIDYKTFVKTDNNLLEDEGITVSIENEYYLDKSGNVVKDGQVITNSDNYVFDIKGNIIQKNESDTDIIIQYDGYVKLKDGKILNKYNNILINEEEYLENNGNGNGNGNGNIIEEFEQVIKDGETTIRTTKVYYKTPGITEIEILPKAYAIEINLWGAGGGSGKQGIYGGSGGYSKKLIEIDKEAKYFTIVGEGGQYKKNGKNILGKSGNINTEAELGSGGGATIFFKFKNNVYEVIAIAGGGGGGGNGAHGGGGGGVYGRYGFGGARGGYSKENIGGKSYGTGENGKSMKLSYTSLDFDDEDGDGIPNPSVIVDGQGGSSSGGSGGGGYGGGGAGGGGSGGAGGSGYGDILKVGGIGHSMPQTADLLDGHCGGNHQGEPGLCLAAFKTKIYTIKKIKYLIPNNSAKDILTIPEGITDITFKAWGAGGGGVPGLNGGPGSYSESSLPVVPGETYHVNVGMAGYRRHEYNHRGRLHLNVTKEASAKAAVPTNCRYSAISGGGASYVLKEIERENVENPDDLMSANRYCRGGTRLFTTTYPDCVQECKDNPECHDLFYHKTNKTCYAHDKCTDFPVSGGYNYLSIKPHSKTENAYKLISMAGGGGGSGSHPVRQRSHYNGFTVKLDKNDNKNLVDLFKTGFGENGQGVGVGGSCTWVRWWTVGGSGGGGFGRGTPGTYMHNSIAGVGGSGHSYGDITSGYKKGDDYDNEINPGQARTDNVNKHHGMIVAILKTDDKEYYDSVMKNTPDFDPMAERQGLCTDDTYTSTPMYPDQLYPNCEQLCYDNPSCKYISYNKETGACYTYSKCTQFTDDKNWVHKIAEKQPKKVKRTSMEATQLEIMDNNSSYIFYTEIRFYDINGTEIPRTKMTAAQSSTLSNNTAYAATQVFDENMGTFSHTHHPIPGNPSWLRINFNETLNISKIRLFVRNNSFGHYNHKITLKGPNGDKIWNITPGDITFIDNRYDIELNIFEEGSPSPIKYEEPSSFKLIETGGTMKPNNISFLGTAFAKDSINTYHSIENINKGLFGNSQCWISKTADSFCGISFNKKYPVYQVAWGRDNTSKYRDRHLSIYTLQYTQVNNPDENTPEENWTTIETLDYTTAPPPTPYKRQLYEFQPVLASGIRLKMTVAGIGIDELEIYQIPIEHQIIEVPEKDGLDEMDGDFDGVIDDFDGDGYLDGFIDGDGLEDGNGNGLNGLNSELEFLSNVNKQVGDYKLNSQNNIIDMNGNILTTSGKFLYDLKGNIVHRDISQLPYYVDGNGFVLNIVKFKLNVEQGFKVKDGYILNKQNENVTEKNVYGMDIDGFIKLI